MSTTTTDIRVLDGAPDTRAGASLLTDRVLNGTPQPVRAAAGAASPLSLATNHVAVEGTEEAPATFRVAVATQETPRAEPCNVEFAGTAAGLLGLGNHADYSWLQSYGSRPFFVNPRGNDVILGAVLDPALPCGVGINTAKPEATLHVNGSTLTRTLTVAESLTIRGVKQIADAGDVGRLRSLAIDPETGTLYYV